MFSKRSRDRVREIVKEIEKDREEKMTDLSEDQVRELVEAHTLLGCRFGIFLLFQVIHQKKLKDNIRTIGSEKLGIDLEDLDDDDKLMRVLSDSENIEMIGESLQASLMESFINDENTAHAQAILTGHAKKDIEELVGAVHGFSDQVDKYYEEHYKDAPDTLSTSIN